MVEYSTEKFTQIRYVSSYVNHLYIKINFIVNSRKWAWS